MDEKSLEVGQGENEKSINIGKSLTYASLIVFLSSANVFIYCFVGEKFKKTLFRSLRGGFVTITGMYCPKCEISEFYI